MSVGAGNQQAANPERKMPAMAVTFLAVGLACTGFPGTLGFVGQELLPSPQNVAGGRKL